MIIPKPILTKRLVYALLGIYERKNIELYQTLNEDTRLQFATKPPLRLTACYGLLLYINQLVMKLSIRLFEIRISKIEGYGLSILGLGLTGEEMAIGFNIKKDKQPGLDTINLYAYLYRFRTKKALKTIPKSHFKCNYCGTPVYSSSGYCQKCNEHMIESELTWVDVK